MFYFWYDKFIVCLTIVILTLIATFQTKIPAGFHRETNKKLSYNRKTWIINIVYFTVPWD